MQQDRPPGAAEYLSCLFFVYIIDDHKIIIKNLSIFLRNRVTLLALSPGGRGSAARGGMVDSAMGPCNQASGQEEPGKDVASARERTRLLGGE